MVPPPPSRSGSTPSADPSAAAGGRALTWIREYLDAVYRYARRRLPEPADAEDVAQETFLALVRADAEGRSPEDAGAWLLGAARRRIADRWRRQGRGHVTVTLPPGWERFADDPLPDEALASEELRELVHVALGLLGASSRVLLLAFHREGRSVRELADRADATPKAIEMRLRRARAAFASRFLEVGRDWLGAGGGDA